MDYKLHRPTATPAAVTAVGRRNDKLPMTTETRRGHLGRRGISGFLDLVAGVGQRLVRPSGRPNVRVVPHCTSVIH